jgi:hypothetical protein
LLSLKINLISLLILLCSLLFLFLLNFCSLFFLFSFLSILSVSILSNLVKLEDQSHFFAHSPLLSLVSVPSQFLFSFLSILSNLVKLSLTIGIRANTMNPVVV